MMIVYRFFKRVDELLDLRRGDGVEGRRRFVHEEHVGLHGERPGDAEALLLPAGEVHGGLPQDVLYLVPEDRLFQALLHQGVQFAVIADARELRCEGDVVVDRFRKGVRFLKNHTDPLADLHGVHLGGVDVPPFEEDLPLHAGAVDQVVHPVEEPKQGRLAAAGRADQGGDAVLFKIQRDVRQRPKGAVEEIHVFCPDDHLFVHAYHLFFLLTMPRRTMATRSIPSTRAIRTSAVPYCSGRVCSIWVPAVART